MAIRIEIEKSIYVEDGYNIRIGDITGSTKISNISKERLIDTLKDEINTLSGKQMKEHIHNLNQMRMINMIPDGIICDIGKRNDKLLILTSSLAERLALPMWFKREPKKHGLKREIEGDLDKLKECKNVIQVSLYVPNEGDE